MELFDFDHMPSIKAVMTPFPYSVDLEAPVSEAEEIMRKHGVRHVPVQHEGELVGVVSDRDIALLVNRALAPLERRRIRVSQICVHDDLYVVDLSKPLDEVLIAMADRHIGSAMVMRKGKLAGIFTTTDACRVLARLLRSRHTAPPDEVA